MNSSSNWPIPPMVVRPEVSPAGNRRKYKRRLIRVAFIVAPLIVVIFAVLVPANWSILSGGLLFIQSHISHWRVARALDSLTHPSIAVVLPRRLTASLRSLPDQITADGITIAVVQIPYSYDFVPSAHEFASNRMLRGIISIGDSEGKWIVAPYESSALRWAASGVTSAKVLDVSSDGLSQTTLSLHNISLFFGVGSEREVDTFRRLSTITGGFGVADESLAANENYKMRYMPLSVSDALLPPAVFAATYFVAADSLLRNDSLEAGCKVLNTLQAQMQDVGLQYERLLPAAYSDHLRCLFLSDRKTEAIRALEDVRRPRTPDVEDVVRRFVVAPVLSNPFGDRDEHGAVFALKLFPSARFAFDVQTECREIRVVVGLPDKLRRNKWKCLKDVYFRYRSLLRDDKDVRKLALIAAIQVQFVNAATFDADSVAAATNSSRQEVCDAFDDDDTEWTFGLSGRIPSSPSTPISICQGNEAKTWLISASLLKLVHTIEENSQTGANASLLTDESRRALLELISLSQIPSNQRDDLRKWILGQRAISFDWVLGQLPDLAEYVGFDREMAAFVSNVARVEILLNSESRNNEITKKEAQEISLLYKKVIESSPDPTLSLQLLLMWRQSRDYWPTPAMPGNRLYGVFVETRADFLAAYPEFNIYVPALVSNRDEEASEEATWLEGLSELDSAHPEIIDALADRLSVAGSVAKAKAKLEELQGMADNILRKDYYEARVDMLSRDKADDCFRVGPMYFSRLHLRVYENWSETMHKAIGRRFISPPLLPYALASKQYPDHKMERMSTRWLPTATDLAESFSGRNAKLPPGAIWLFVQGGILASADNPVERPFVSKEMPVEVFSACKGWVESVPGPP